jgi:hypothetical protein
VSEAGDGGGAADEDEDVGGAEVGLTEEEEELPAMRDAHGHRPYPITNGERKLLSAWLKQGRDWLML